VAKHAKFSIPTTTVRTRRAYFDCKFGQLHVRTAFPATGGFDEGVTLICLHHNEDTSRTFARFLPEIADDRSVYAPDLPGCGESDPAPALHYADSAAAIVDLAKDLRLRQIDLLGMRFGAGVALELAASHPELVRRLVLVAAPPIESLPIIKKECLVMRIRVGAAEDNPQWA
jgi:pimeloyl-ACP methyl ester carboxylesterase